MMTNLFFFWMKIGSDQIRSEVLFKLSTAFWSPSQLNANYMDDMDRWRRCEMMKMLVMFIFSLVNEMKLMWALPTLVTPFKPPISLIPRSCTQSLKIGKCKYENLLEFSSWRGVWKKVSPTRNLSFFTFPRHQTQYFSTYWEETQCFKICLKTATKEDIQFNWNLI